MIAIVPEVVQRELRKRERPLWVGYPHAKRFAVAESWGTFLFGIPWTGFVVFWEYNAMDAGLFATLWGIPFIVVGLGMLGSPLWQYWKGLRTIYVVTDQRLLIINGVVRPSVQSYVPPFDIELKERSDGSGTIIFACEERRGGKGSTYTDKIGFVAIPNVRECEHCITTVGKEER